MFERQVRSRIEAVVVRRDLDAMMPSSSMAELVPDDLLRFRRLGHSIVRRVAAFVSFGETVVAEPTVHVSPVDHMVKTSEVCPSRGVCGQVTHSCRPAR